MNGESNLNQVIRQKAQLIEINDYLGVLTNQAGASVIGDLSFNELKKFYRLVSEKLSYEENGESRQASILELSGEATVSTAVKNFYENSNIIFQYYLDLDGWIIDLRNSVSKNSKIKALGESEIDEKLNQISMNRLKRFADNPKELISFFISS